MEAPLRRNRDFMLLQFSQLVSSGGSQITAIAYPLLVLSLTGSSAKAGLVAFARLLPSALFALPAGLAADRWNRRRVMLGAHVTRSVAVGTLGLLIVADEIVFWVIPIVAFVEGVGSAFYGAAQAGALRAVVPQKQLPAAVSVVTGREAVVIVAAPPVGGALFGVARALPFLVHAMSYAVSTVLLLLMRTPFQEERESDVAPLRTRLAEGFRFLWNHAFLRTMGLPLRSRELRRPGSAARDRRHREGRRADGRPSRLARLGVGWSGSTRGVSFAVRSQAYFPCAASCCSSSGRGTGCAAFLVWPNVYVLAASIVPTGLAIPSTDSVVRSYELSMTPDRILGRVESARSTIALMIAPLGPLVAGLLLDVHVGTRDDRGLRRVRARPRALGDAQPGDPRSAATR